MMKLLTLLLPAVALASNTTQASNATQAAGTQAAGTQAAGTQAAGTQAAGTQAAGTQAAGASGTQAAAAKPAATTAAKAGNTTAVTGDKKLKFEIPAVKVSIDFTKVNTDALKKKAAQAVFDGVKGQAEGVKTGGSLYAKFDSKFGTAHGVGAGYDSSRRLAAEETSNDFKYVVKVSAADFATEQTAMNDELKKASVFSEGSLATAISTAWTAAGVPGNVTVKFTKPTMTAVDGAAAAGTTTSSAVAMTGFVALAFTGFAALL